MIFKVKPTGPFSMLYTEKEKWEMADKVLHGGGRTVRYSTLVKMCGEPKEIGGLEYQIAIVENRVMTVMDYGYGLVGEHCVDTAYRLVFEKPIPDGIYKVIGITYDPWSMIRLKEKQIL